MAISEAKHRANEKWNAANLEEIKIRVKKGQKAVIQQAAQSTGESVNGFIVRLIDEELTRLNSRPGEDFHPADE